MSTEQSSSDPSPVDDFIVRFMADQDSLRVQPLSHYQRLFPGDDEGLATEYRALLGLAETPSITSDGHASADSGSEEATERFGPYRLVRLIGSGGQGQVHEAIDTRLGRRVALKTLLTPGLAFGDLRQRFEREARLAAQLRDPGLCSIHEHGVHDGVAYIAMELVEGTTLRDLIQTVHVAAAPDTESARKSTAVVLPTPSAQTAKGPQPATTTVRSSSSLEREEIRRIATLFVSVAESLHTAHEAGIVHRDIKPANIMVRDNGQPVILDFGLARAEDQDGLALTGSDAVLGTPQYMSPEQIRGEVRHLDRRTDVWSLGVCLFEALTAQRPFTGATYSQLAAEITGPAEPKVRRLNPNLPRDLGTIVGTAMSKEPSTRYASALDFADELRRFVELRPIQARPIGPVTRLSRWARRNPVVASLTAALFLVLATATGWTSVQAARLEATNTNLARKSREAEAAAETAQRKEAEAAQEARAKALALAGEQAERREKEAALAEYERLADTKRLANAKAASDALWPVAPDLVEGLLQWQEEFATLLAPETLAGHEAALKRLRERAEPYTEEDRQRDFESELVQILELEANEAELVTALVQEDNAEANKAGEQQLASLRQSLAQLRETMQGQGSWRFTDTDEEFRHEILAQLVADLREVTADDRTRAQASIADRLLRSRRIAELTTTGKAAAKRWTDAIARIRANPSYRISAEERERLGPVGAPAGLFDEKGWMTLCPQVGLIPLGPDPRSGLEEFLHLESHAHDGSSVDLSLPARRPITEKDARGGFAMTPDTGVILVLIPAGYFLMGSQNEDAAKPNFDPAHDPSEVPVHEVSLGGYFLSKYELTQGQWARVSARVGVGEPSPSRYGIGAFEGRTAILPSAVDGTHPVESVDWLWSSELPVRVGLELPTEAQWERAARADHPSLQWAGVGTVEELVRIANISGDETEGPASVWQRSPEHRDAYVVHAPAGSFLPNGFGLHDMTGNMWEWCRDGFIRYDVAPTAGDGLREAPSSLRVYRGGGFSSPVSLARVAARIGSAPAVRDVNLGLRPSRGITTE